MGGGFWIWADDTVADIGWQYEQYSSERESGVQAELTDELYDVVADLNRFMEEGGTDAQVAAAIAQAYRILGRKEGP